MKISVTRQELKTAVTGLSKVVDSNSYLPVLSRVKFTTGQNGVSVTGTNLDEYAEYSFTESKTDGAGSALVPLAVLKGFTKGADSDHIEISAGKDSVYVVNHIGSQSITKNPDFVPLDDWPAQAVSSARKPVPGFLDAFRFVMPCTSKDETRYILQGVHLEVGDRKPGGSSLVATDGRWLVYSNSATLGLDESITVRANPFLGWQKLTGCEELGADKTWFNLSAGSWVYWSKLIQGTYPNYKPVIPAEAGANKVVFTDADTAFLSTVLAQFPADAGIELRAGRNNCLKLTARNDGEKKDSVIETANGTTFTGSGNIRFGNHYFSGALNAGFKTLTFADEWTPGVFVHDNRKMIIMPLRPQGNPPAPASVKVIQESGVPTERKPETAPVAVPKQEEPAAGNAQTITSTEPVITPVQDTTKPVKEKNMAEKTEQAVESGMAKVEAIIEAARVKIRELNAAFNDVASELKAMAKDMKAQDKEVESVRATLQKLQSMKL